MSSPSIDTGLIDPNELLVNTPPEADEEVTEEDVEAEADLSYEDGLDDGLNLNNEIIPKPEDVVVRRREYTRSRLALLYTIATFVIFFLGMTIAVIDGLINNSDIVDNLREVISIISGVFLGSLGFVLGYYFRRPED